MYRTWIPRVFVCLALGLLAPPTAWAAELPTSLAVIPGDAAAFVSVNVAGVLNSPLCDEVRFALGALKPAELAAFAKKFPIDPLAVERVVVVLPNATTVTDPMPDLHPTAFSALAVVACSKPFDPVPLVKGFNPKSYRGKVYQFDEDNWLGLLLLDDRTFVVGAEDSLVWFIDRLVKPDAAGTLSSARAEAADHTVFVAVNPATALPPTLTLPPTLRPLADAKRVCLAVDLGKTIKGSLELHYADAAGATAGETALKAAFELARAKLKDVEADLKKVIDKPTPGDRAASPGEFPERFVALLGVGVLRRLDEGIAALPVKRDGATVRVAAEMTMPSSGGALVVVSIAAITTLGTNANATFQYVGDAIRPPGPGPVGPTPQEIRLKKLGDAFDAYSVEHGHYPPAATFAKDGTPLLSWRVALLPYLGEKKLYDEFKQDEPWDSLHNKKLLAKMPEVFNKPYVYPKNYGKTNAVVVVGQGTLFDGVKGVKKPVTGNPLLAVESADDTPVWWTKPIDRLAAPGKPPELFGKFNHTCWALFTDGSVQRLTKTEHEKMLPDLIAKPK